MIWEAAISSPPVIMQALAKQNAEDFGQGNEQRPLVARKSLQPCNVPAIEPAPADTVAYEQTERHKRCACYGDVCL